MLGGVFGNNLLYVGMLPDFLNESADVTPPVITLSGNNPISVNQGVYSIENGKAQNLMNEELKVIDATIIDEVSEKLGNEFEQL